MMDKTEENEQLDADILECKADILRVRDIIPGGMSPKGKNQQGSKSQISSCDGSLADKKKETSTKDKYEKSDIPRLDLAEDIMSEQRKAISVRRKSPEKEPEIQIKDFEDKLNSYTIKKENGGLSEQEQIIAEIVARDIERLRRSKTSGVR